MFIKRLVTPGISANTYIIGDSHSKRVFIIDPTRNINPIIEALEEIESFPSYIIETHVHADFVSGAKELKHRYGNAPIIACSALGGEEWIPAYADQYIKDKDVLNIDFLQLQAWHTPGHTPEHIIWILSDISTFPAVPTHAFTGDFLFIGSVGRPDLLGEEAVQNLSEKLYHSVFTVLPQLPSGIEILPAHGAGSRCGKSIASESSSTLAKEWHSNPALSHIEKEKWIEGLLKNMPPAPKYFKKMKKINIQGPSLLGNLTEMQSFTLSQYIDNPRTSRVLVDIRSSANFALGHLTNSINIPYGPSFISWAPEIIGYEAPVTILYDQQENLIKALRDLHLVGIDAIYEGVKWDFIEQQLLPAGYVEKSYSMTPKEAYAFSQQNEKVQFLDVRTAGEWGEGHINNAFHGELSGLQDSLPVGLHRDAFIFAVCGSGYRSAIALSVLQKAGFKRVCNITGGMHDWICQQLPMTVS